MLLKQYHAIKTRTVQRVQVCVCVNCPTIHVKKIRAAEYDTIRKVRSHAANEIVQNRTRKRNHVTLQKVVKPRVNTLQWNGFYNITRPTPCT